MGDKGAMPEKAAALDTASYFAERKGRADWDAFDRLMARREGEAPRPGDELPEEQSSPGSKQPT